MLLQKQNGASMSNFSCFGIVIIIIIITVIIITLIMFYKLAWYISGFNYMSEDQKFVDQ